MNKRSIRSILLMAVATLIASSCYSQDANQITENPTTVTGPTAPETQVMPNPTSECPADGAATAAENLAGAAKETGDDYVPAKSIAELTNRADVVIQGQFAGYTKEDVGPSSDFISEETLPSSSAKAIRFLNKDFAHSKGGPAQSPNETPEGHITNIYLPIADTANIPLEELSTSYNFVAFLEKNSDEVFSVIPQGLWVSCGLDTPSFIANEPSLAQQEDLGKPGTLTEVFDLVKSTVEPNLDGS